MYVADRKFIIFALLGVCGFFLILDLVNVLLGETTMAYFWGVPIGIVLGISFCLLISKKWDPENLRMKNSNGSSKTGSWVWTVPLGVFIANILLSFFNSIIADLIVGVVGGWLYVFLGYVAFQVWRYRPK